MSHVSENKVQVKITRAWNDLAPKLLAFLTGGTAATVLIAVLHNYFGVAIDPALANVIVVVTGSVLGYFVKDNATIPDAPSIAITNQFAEFDPAEAQRIAVRTLRRTLGE